MKVAWTQQAQERLQEVDEFISQDSPERATLFVDRLIQRGDRLGLFPKSGRRVPELESEDIREVLEGNYRIVYRVKPLRIEILTIVEGHRLLPLEDIP